MGEFLQKFLEVVTFWILVIFFMGVLSGFMLYIYSQL